MKIKREIFNCLGMCIATNIITVYNCKTFKEYCDSHGGFMHLGGKQFSVKVGPLLNQITTKYRLLK